MKSSNVCLVIYIDALHNLSNSCQALSEHLLSAVASVDIFFSVDLFLCWLWWIDVLECEVFVFTSHHLWSVGHVIIRFHASLILYFRLCPSSQAHLSDVPLRNY